VSDSNKNFAKNFLSFILSATNERGGTLFGYQDLQELQA
jgi:hypothetical protein